MNKLFNPVFSTKKTDAIDEAARNIYLRYGLIDLPGSGKMVLSMKTIGSLFL